MQFHALSILESSSAATQPSAEKKNNEKRAPLLVARSFGYYGIKY